MENNTTILNDLKHGQLVKIHLLDGRVIIGRIERIEISRLANENDVRLTIRSEDGTIMYIFFKRIKMIEILNNQ